MIARLKTDCSIRERAEIVTLIEKAGLRVRIDRGGGSEWIGAFGSDAPRNELLDTLRTLPAVLEIARDASPYPLASRDYFPQSTRVRVGEVEIGEGTPPTLIAGPCAVESRAQMRAAARTVAENGGHLLRGGAFKPRTSPYSFQGLGEAGLELLAEAGREVGLPVVTEVVAPEDVELVASYADVLQIGARNMQNFRLLQAAGRATRPVILKRGHAATLDELMHAAEYVLDAGNPDVILCERGIRSFDPATRATLDLAAVPVLRELTHLPLLVDPSHAAGRRALVPPLARAALAVGADGLLVEVHPDPASALSDGPQALTPDDWKALVASLPALVGGSGAG